MSTPTSLRLGARRSPLAVVQAEYIADLLRADGHEVEIVGIISDGDTDRRALTEIGGTGVFAAAVRARLLDGSIDLAVHSLKDLPVAAHPGLVVAAMPARERVNDVLVGRPISEWTNDTLVGTGSPRRQAQLAALVSAHGVTPRFLPVRGNVDTRLNLVATGEVEATVLAHAGLARLGKIPGGAPTAPDTMLDTTSGTPVRIAELALDQMLPAPGQGSLAVECRDDDHVRALLARLDDPATRAAVTAERAFLATLEAGCLAPVGAFARVEDDLLALDVAVADAAGGLVRLHDTAALPGWATDPAEWAGPDRLDDAARHLGHRLAERVLERLDGNRLGGPIDPPYRASEVS